MSAPVKARASVSKVSLGWKSEKRGGQCRRFRGSGDGSFIGVPLRALSLFSLQIYGGALPEVNPGIVNVELYTNQMLLRPRDDSGIVPLGN